jgi:hypothetical protein
MSAHPTPVPAEPTRVPAEPTRVPAEPTRVPAEPAPRRSGMTVTLAVVAALVGLVWIAQGLGAPIGRSFMVGDLRWTAIGAALVACAAVLAWRRLRHSG